MLLYNIDYMAAEGQPVRIVSIIGFTSEEQARKDPLQANSARLQARAATDIASLGEPIQVALWQYKAKKDQQPPEGLLSDAIWQLLQGGKPEEEVEKTASPPPEKSNKITKKKSKKASTPKAGKATSASPEGAVASAETKEGQMAAKKKTAKKTAKKTERKASNGLPREGTKAAKLLDLIKRPGGATFAEMQKATGWKEMRGTASDLAKRVGKTLKIIETEGKPSRWAAK